MYCKLATLKNPEIKGTEHRVISPNILFPSGGGKACWESNFHYHFLILSSDENRERKWHLAVLIYTFWHVSLDETIHGLPYTTYLLHQYINKLIEHVHAMIIDISTYVPGSPRGTREREPIQCCPRSFARGSSKLKVKLIKRKWNGFQFDRTSV